MIDIAFCIPGDLSLPTGGYRYDRELIARLPAQGIAAHPVRLPGGFPHPSSADLAATGALLAAAPGSGPLFIDGLALGAMPPSLVTSLPRGVVALVHHPLCLETGLSPERAGALRRNEAEVLRGCRAIVVTSRETKRWLVDEFGLDGGMITVAEPGIERRERARGHVSPLNILAVGAVSERKAYPLLVEALAASRDLDWRLTIAGSTTLSAEASDRLREAITRAGLADRITLTGAISDDALAGLYAGADIFASSSLHEGYGMAIAEALAHGLAVVASSAGAANDLLSDGAALKVPQGDVAALAAALRRALSDPALRRLLSDGAWEAAKALPDWEGTARIVGAVLQSLAATGRAP